MISEYKIYFSAHDLRSALKPIAGKKNPRNWVFWRFSSLFPGSFHKAKAEGEVPPKIDAQSIFACLIPY